MNMGDREFLGRGWNFPVGVDEATGRIKTCSYEEDIEQAIMISLSTRRGERAMRPEFGSLLHTYAFEDTSQGSLSAIAEEIRNCLSRWEPRITDIEVLVSGNGVMDGRVDISVSYTVRGTNSPFNLVFPFYMNEGAAAYDEN